MTERVTCCGGQKDEMLIWNDVGLLMSEIVTRSFMPLSKLTSLPCILMTG